MTLDINVVKYQVFQIAVCPKIADYDSGKISSVAMWCVHSVTPSILGRLLKRKVLIQR